MNIKIIIITCCVVFLLYFFSVENAPTYEYEHLQNTDKEKYNTVYSESIQLLDDPLFSDVILYNNDPDPYDDGQKTGLQKCFDECNGVCVEFGISGIAYCFPHEIKN